MNMMAFKIKMNVSLELGASFYGLLGGGEKLVKVDELQHCCAVWKLRRGLPGKF